MKNRKGNEVEPRIHLEVRRRDGECLAAKYGFAHQCRNEYGEAHPATAIDALTVEHLWRSGGGAMGRKAPSDPQHMVAVCHWINAAHMPTKAMRASFREHLDRLYGAET